MRNLNTSKCGVYAIIAKNKNSDDEYYIGSAIDIWNSRKSNHMNKFKNDKFPYPNMQLRYNEDKNNIVLDLVEECEPYERKAREKWWKNYFSMVDGITVVNKNDINEIESKPWSDEGRENLSKAMSGENNPNARLTESDVIWIRDLFATGKMSIEKIADMFKISEGHCKHIIDRDKWKCI